ncbi:MAG: aldehyde ferredoxin oxidoreductase family protein [Gammaproteobacteria bacterium]|nr:aldehyde ferredoxin oxidoreductase family protein [Gammaproteobacteria bacterium]MBL6999605.1 aldehyde ferredoxin oxidoreductase family protein [Gammaproteobacteria bacterium]
MSWTRKILRVNLTQGTCTPEPLNMQWANDYLGQRGLATKYLCEEIDPKCDPLSPENKMIMATGPLTGTMASTAGRYSVITKGPLTNAIACSNSGGFLGNEFKNAGWDMIIFEGKSPEPVYLWISNDQVELRSAAAIWGKSAWETDDILHQIHQDPQIRVACVGRTAETGCLYSGIINDKHRAAGRSGVGTVMASKNLKAVAVRGTLGVGNVRDFGKFMSAVNDAKKVLADNAVTGQGLPAYGTQVLMNVMNGVGGLPSYNMKNVGFEGAQNISGEAMHEPRASDGKANLTTNAACFGCTIACGRISTVDKTHFTIENKPQYWGASGGLEYESAWSLGADTGIDDLNTITFVNFLCNEDGFDPISYGCTVAAAMEMFEAGDLTLEDTGGIELRFGSSEAFVQATEALVSGQGFGKDLGLGSKRLCEKYGRPELSMQVKGLEFPAYDPRGLQGIGLNYATSNRGACHVRGYTVASEILGIPVKTEQTATEGKAELVKAFQDATALVDSAGLCLFTTFAWGMDNIAPQVDGACEGDWTVEKCLEVGERIWNLERQFNNDAGFTSNDDKLPRRMLEEAIKGGPTDGQVNRLGEMLPKYYEIRGWTDKGEITAETKARLSL